MGDANETRRPDSFQFVIYCRISESISSAIYVYKKGK